jgi:hypothetical protein
MRVYAVTLEKLEAWVLAQLRAAIAIEYELTRVRLKSDGSINCELTLRYKINKLPEQDKALGDGS